ncbi:hypothetical protein DL765_006496 [Monosporascus sp. GIB2]|nr:hypothetical protein DL765_006496 [Monosporascus sp. GIB2]
MGTASNACSQSVNNVYISYPVPPQKQISYHNQPSGKWQASSWPCPQKTQVTIVHSEAMKATSILAGRPLMTSGTVRLPAALAPSASLKSCVWQHKAKRRVALVLVSGVADSVGFWPESISYRLVELGWPLLAKLLAPQWRLAGKASAGQGD